MRKNILLILSIALFGLTACTEDVFDRLNKDKQHPSTEVVPAYLQLTDAIMSTGFTTVSGDYAFYLSSLNEQSVGIGNNQLMRAELRNSGEWASSTTFNNVWNGTYANLLNIREIIRKVEDEVPGNIGQFDILGMAQVLEAINFGILTDLHGDIPYSEALQGKANLQPKLDAQKDIYAGILSTLDAALSNLEKGRTLKNAGKQDIAFGGDINQWKATAYALKARYLLHQLAVNPDVLEDVEKNAEEAVKLGFKGFLINEFNGVTTDNPWSAFIWSRAYTASSLTVANLMEATGDPRYPYYVYEDEDQEGNVIPGEAYEPGDEDIAKVADGSLAFPAWYDLGAQPIHVFSKSELYFILAEVQLRLGKDATDAFQTAVGTSVSEILELFKDNTSASDYAESLGAPTLQKLFEQKYLAQSYDEQVETYNDLRRLKAMGEEYVKLTNPWNTQSGVNRYPERLPYGNSGVIGNPNVKEAYGDGFYIYTQKTWVNNK
ncbi:SusD/RagB family nutrient-binding outer membrane lipoprotein [Proteiniphilum sp. UBA5384]|uniref:SusD/RagB family nutrient-binding outer membrane lipoprotein n=1 Tax=Proteiniphilum sp. UBA5384 TaxID=1947279 RepID=UPI0025F08E46|nr:SusD/RagB family nutrient-binding outer membrane lipoprotein [Proteiniphilum sp. UBA5384]